MVASVGHDEYVLHRGQAGAELVPQPAAVLGAEQSSVGRSDGLEAPYSRAVAVSGDELLLSASDGPRGGHAAVYRGGLTDGRFERCTDGIPAWFDDNIYTYCLDSLNDGSFAG